MEYIQCSHCNKKYGVNDKIRAAAGRTINCKSCGESFEIELFETPSPSIPQTSQLAHAEEKKSEEVMKKEENNNPPVTKKKKEKRNRESEPIERKKFAPSMILGVAIIALSIYAFYQDRSIDIGQPFVATETPRPKPSVNAPAQLGDQEQASIIGSKTIVYEKLSKACKDIAAQQWVMDYTMMHGMPESSEYVHMLDESTQNTAEIREKCGGASIVQEVLATAKEGSPPEWLKEHVSKLITLDKETPHF
ncbi:MAG: zinc-ribbon domain-containing protein [Mariprofundaceae bacterium]|nr:zinc-ribbon domain-containing protein [Mariprofundaceae bacterium]